MIRKACISDIPAVHGILSSFANKGDLLGRSLSELYDNLRDFYVCVQDETGSLIGTCALHICWEGLAEIRSLAVSENSQGKGIGKSLARSCIDEAVALGISRVFTLTNRPEFFSRIGFSVADKATLPHKIWADCMKCYKFPQCDEVALVLEVKGL